MLPPQLARGGSLLGFETLVECRVGRGRHNGRLRFSNRSPRLRMRWQCDRIRFGNFLGLARVKLVAAISALYAGRRNGWAVNGEFAAALRANDTHLARPENSSA